MLQEFLEQKGFEFTNKPTNGASYIMQDGLFLCLNNNKKFFRFSIARNPNHCDLDNYICRERDGFERQRDILRKNNNAIRVNDGTNFVWENAYIRLPSEKPTESQFKSLEDWVFMLVGSKKCNFVEIFYNHDRMDAVRIDENAPEYAINYIRTIYATSNQE